MVRGIAGTGLFRLFAAFTTTLLLAGTSPGLADQKPPDSPPGTGLSPAALAGFVRLPGHVLPALAHAARIIVTPEQAREEAAEPITLTIVLKRDDQVGFERYLHDVYDSRSPNFRHFLTQQQLADRFGPSQKNFDAVLSYLEANGFKLNEGSSNRLTITITGTRAQAERGFDIEIRDYTASGARFHTNDRNPALPAFLAEHVQALAGLSNRAVPRPTNPLTDLKDALCRIAVVISCRAIGSGTVDLKNFTCNEFNSFAYDYSKYCKVNASSPSPAINVMDGSLPVEKSVKRLPNLANAVAWNNATGAGQTVALLEFDTFNVSDVSDYLALTQQPASLINQLSKVDVNDGVLTPGAGEGEVLLDIDAVLSIAPGAKVVVYDAPFSGPGNSFQAIFNRMLDDKVTIISNSWAYCEDQTTLADVQSIDSIFQTAAASGISIFNGAGDSGSTCLDGNPYIAVPADSPNATTVGGSSEDAGPAFTYNPETWWDDSATSPPAGQGGFGLSTFFAVPGYQTLFNGTGMRSIPDVVVNADPFYGVWICQADNGGCPTGALNGGTSMATPIWAAFAAQLNEAQGANLGFLNPQLYALANTKAFHNAASLGSDFAHVGLGSPIGSTMHLLLSGTAAGAVDPAASSTGVSLPVPSSGISTGGVPDDGTTAGFVTVSLSDSNGDAIAGKTVSLSASAGTHSLITPPSAVTTADNGTATFNVTDADAENVTFTATDTTDGIQIAQQASLSFVTPPAAAAGIGASPPSVPADGTTSSTVTVTLDDSLGRPTPGKLVNVDQGIGRSVINGPNPSVTDSNGQIAFTVTNVNTETDTYTATDITDGNLPVPGSASVSFTSGAGTGCAASNPTPAIGSNYTYSNFVTGFPITSENCLNPAGMAFDSSGNFYVSDYAGGSPQGGLYKFPPTGGIAGAAFRLNASPYAAFTCASGLAFSKDGMHLYMAQQGCNSGGSVVEVSTADGHVISQLAALDCASGLAADPVSGDLFVSQPCPRGTSNISRISNPESGSPALSVYSSGVGGAGTLVFTPDGSLWTEAYRFDQSTRYVAKIDGTNTATPGAFTYLTTAFPNAFGILPALNPANPGSPPFLVSANAIASTGQTGDISLIDLTQNPPTQSDIFTGGSVVAYMIAGPDDCLYASETDRVIRITKSDGTCPFATSSPLQSLSLSPRTVDPVQGTPQTLTATLTNVTSPAGTPITFVVSGANPRVSLVDTDANGQAAFTYSAVHSGTDQVVASASPGGTNLTSNTAQITWTAGPDTTFLTLNPSAKGGMPGQDVTLTASLTDVSQNPPAALANQPVMLKLGENTCGTVMTDINGLATCTIPSANITIIPGQSVRPISAAFAGTDTLTASNAADSFLLTAPSQDAKLTVTPKTLHFPAETVLGGVGVTSKPKILNVFNPKNKKQDLTITFLGAGNTGDFTILDPAAAAAAFASTGESPALASPAATTCGTSLAPKSRCTIAVTFTPIGAGKRVGTLMVEDNATTDAPQIINLVGTGKQGKLTYKPKSLGFGKESVGTPSAAGDVTISNPNAVPMAFAASVSGDYAIASNTCPDTLPANSAPCTISVTFTPTTTGSRPGSLTLTDTAVGSPQTVKLSGTGD